MYAVRLLIRVDFENRVFLVFFGLVEFDHVAHLVAVILQPLLLFFNWYAAELLVLLLKLTVLSAIFWTPLDDPLVILHFKVEHDRLIRVLRVILLNYFCELASLSRRAWKSANYEALRKIVAAVEIA